MEKVTPEEAVKMLEEEGIYVTIEQATVVLEFFSLIASISIKQYLDHEDC